ncbi:MAG: ketoacyl-ACP synthase III [Roseburia sp.]|nr:ketoacyl-ACP synthase III [Muribaculum sp.]MCM1440120.1 ketoacyl-ACP synthase III [Roseburia sp.]
MAKITYDKVGIRAMAACVPQKIAYNKDLTAIMSEEEVDKMISSVGIHERRICDNDTTASDLCFAAAKKLMADNDIALDSIDMLLFMSQTADFQSPATACILQNRLGLSKDCAAMDLSLACSGFVYGLSAAMAFASMPGINRVLLLDGETFSKVVNPRDKVNVPLYGDAGTATLVEKGDFAPSTFILHTDGSGEDAVKIPAGIRNGVTEESCKVTERENGNFRSDLEVYMDGMAVFNFAIKVVPKGVKEMMSATGEKLDDLNWLVFHQSNKFMTDFFIKKLKFDSNKVPYCIGRFGNTSSASVPLTIVSELKGKLKDNDKVVMCGFGAGLSWGTVFMQFNGCNISDLVEYHKH